MIRFSRLLAGPVVVLLTGAAPPARSPAEIVEAARAQDWRPVDPDRLLVLTLGVPVGDPGGEAGANGAPGSGRTVLLELAPDFAPVHVRNIQALARAGWWDGAAIVRVQDNYVVQWSRPQENSRLPPGVVPNPPAEYERPASGLALVPLGFPDAYAPVAGWADGFPAASDGKHIWLAHCYGMVGVGRDMPPDTGTGAELYAVNGQAPRQLDRNIALVGRVVDGMELLSALPRGAAPMGFYTDPKQRVPIRSARIAADLPAAQRPSVALLPPDSAPFRAALAARADRRDPFYVRPAGATDLCSVPLPSRHLRR